MNHRTTARQPPFLNSSTPQLLNTSTFKLSWITLLAGCFSLLTVGQSQREKLDLPGFEQGDLYVLSRLSNDELLRVERSEWVHVAILVRNGLELQQRREAITGLAAIRKTDESTQILAGLVRAQAEADESMDALNDLSRLLLATSPAQLQGNRARLIDLASNADHELVRQSTFAALMLAEEDSQVVWRLAENSDQGLVDLMKGIAKISDPETLKALRPKIQTVLQATPHSEIRQGAILALASIPGNGKQTFELLASFFRAPGERDAAVQALLNVPADQWPKQQAQELIPAVMDYLQQVDPTRRNTDEFKRARQLGESLAALLPDAQGRDTRKILATMGIRTVTLRAVPFSMRFDRTHMVVQAGSPIEITLENPDMWLHNLVIVAPGALEEIGTLAGHLLTDSATWKGLAFVPDSNKVRFATRIVKTLESDTITIVAPDQVGDYPYLCTYPGHWVSMNGILHVVADVDAWIAAHPVEATGSDPGARSLVKDWQLRDFANDLADNQKDRSLANGKSLFTTATCAACHRVGDIGGSIGPELGEAAQRLSAADMLSEIIEPSKTINERYRISLIQLQDDTSLAGVITRQDARTIYLADPAQSDVQPQAIARDQIAGIQSLDISTMPEGLLNSFSKDEILNLLAYIRSGGKTE